MPAIKLTTGVLTCFLMYSAAFSSASPPISPIITLADGGEWLLQGNLIEKDYTVTSGGAVVATISQKFLTVRDAYTLEVSSPGLERGQRAGDHAPA